MKETFELQHQSDLLLYSFAKQVKAQGGKLRIVAEFPDSPNVTFPNFDHFDDGLTDEERIRQTLGMEPDEPIPTEWLQHPADTPDEIAGKNSGPRVSAARRYDLVIVLARPTGMFVRTFL